ncbi:MAG: 2-C-methyl-D-erythritol 2,4-cyclodiphosphate synthase [Mogibacterium sp.]|nr:2-C-methyl-D-erythritol 2,4-cyclodiphosphate synthase [Mogibacterium sp.]
MGKRFAETTKNYAVIVAAGKGRRMGIDMPKQLLPFGTSTILGTSAYRFASHKDMDGIIIVAPSDGSLDEIYKEIAAECEERSGREAGFVSIVRGGAERGDSVKEGLKRVSEISASAGTDPEQVIVLIHDAVRPGISADIISRNIEALESCRAVCTAMPASDSIRMINIEKSGYDGALPLKEAMTYPIMNTDVVRRDLVFRAQTPQSFRLSDINAAYAEADRNGYASTDDASIAEYAGFRVALVEGSAANNKITHLEDIHMGTRVGTGYDVHRLVPGRDLILCGTPIPNKLGLDGHSDADVATHALMDALLGAAGLGDIGRHFPDTDDRYKGADSMKLLAEVRRMLGEVKINNADITIIAQAPKLAPYIEQMTLNVSKVLGIPESAVNVKATTEEGLGFTGRGEGIAAMAAVSIEGSF